jgi:hypothetical protein
MAIQERVQIIGGELRQRFVVAMVEHKPPQHRFVAVPRCRRAALYAQGAQEPSNFLPERIAPVRLVFHVELSASLRSPLRFGQADAHADASRGSRAVTSPNANKCAQRPSAAQEQNHPRESYPSE